MAHEPEQVLLPPAGEHRAGDLGGASLGAPGRDDLGLVPALLIEAGHLTTGEVAASAVIGDAYPTIGQVIGRLVPEAVGHRHRHEGTLGLATERPFAIGEDVEAGGHDLLEARRPQPPRSKAMVGRTFGPSSSRTSTTARRSSPMRAAPGSQLHTSTASPRASVSQVSIVAAMAMRAPARWARAGPSRRGRRGRSRRGRAQPSDRDVPRHGGGRGCR